MKTVNLPLWLGFFALVAGCAGSTPPPTASSLGGSSHQEAEAEEVEGFFMEGIGRFNRRETDAFMDQFDDDIRMFAVSDWLRGKPALRKRFDDTFKQFPNVKMEITNLHARSEAPGAVTVEFEFHTFPRGAGPAYHGIGSGVYVKRPGGWREVLEHETVTKRDPSL